MDKFQKQLANGHIYEMRSLMYMEHDTYIQSKGIFKPYDLIIKKDGKETKIEVKSDRQAGRTGNMAIEFECNNKPSGITSTEADYYIYFIIYCDDIQEDGTPREECYKIPVKRLKKIASKCRKVRGGDGNRSCMYLVHKSLVLGYLINKISDFNSSYNIIPTMKNQTDKTDEVKPLSYSQRLINSFKEDEKDTYNLTQIEWIINQFSKLEYEKRKAITDEMPFGKYKFKKVVEVAKFDKPYLKWLVRQEMMNKYEELKLVIEENIN
jgi:uncharacterized protein (DUF3820 family)